MSKTLPNNSEEANEKLTELLLPALEFLNTLEVDKGNIGFFKESDKSFKSTTIRITIREQMK